MNSKNYFVGAKNFKSISAPILLEATEIQLNEYDGAVVYAKFTEEDENILISGNIGAMVCAIAEMIIMISSKSNFPITALLKSITNTVYGIKTSEV